MPAAFKPVVLMILDGLGITNEKEGNAFLNANNVSTFKELDNYYPKTLLQASGISVGLPWLQYGNSEVGHQTIGTGQVTFQDLPRITNSIKNGTFFENETILKAIQTVKKNKAKLHLLGLASDGGVNAHIDHLLALLDIAKTNGIENRTFIHAIMDGRDAPPMSGTDFIKKILNNGIGQIATLSGRFYTMDRNNNWERIKKGYEAMALGKGIKETDPLAALKKQYDRNLTDEYIKPVVITKNDNPVGPIQANDMVIFLNYRKDRAKQIAEVFLNPGFDQFERSLAEGVQFLSMIKYAEELQGEVIFPPQEIKTRVSEIISSHGLNQLKIAETEKYAHVTYFFNGGNETPYERENQILVPSKNVTSFDEAPEMSALEITQKLVEEIDKDIYDFILVNYANPDMVGHTGTYEAGLVAIDNVNYYMREVIKKVLEKKGCLVITADHGNIEEMINLKTGEKDTQHSNNPVPCWIVNPKNRKPAAQTTTASLGVQGMLVDVAPTILNLLDINPSGLIGMDLRRIVK
ncbi:MAG: 2,3-bisphosphoglycerate-independent phosphoglycerate mutase [Candidatus Moranbacteria bacterium]|nr:2,3-bisphosphoglycerate-independent phosphoglycerate mutase [Candidatus Moranbacteria bacterium]